MGLELDKATERQLVESIRRYLETELDCEAGELKAKLFLQFCLAEIAPAIYNKAVADARDRMQERVMDLENICFLPEGGYWKGKRR